MRVLLIVHNDTEVDTIQGLTVGLKAEPTGLVEVERRKIKIKILSKRAERGVR